MCLFWTWCCKTLQTLCGWKTLRFRLRQKLKFSAIPHKNILFFSSESGKQAYSYDKQTLVTVPCRNSAADLRKHEPSNAYINYVPSETKFPILLRSISFFLLQSSWPIARDEWLHIYLSDNRRRWEGLRSLLSKCHLEIIPQQLSTLE